MIQERKIISGRGPSKQNKLLLMADNLLFDTEKVLEEKKIKKETDKTIIKEKLFFFLGAISCLIGENRSVDQWVDGYGLSDKVKEFIADAYVTFWEVETLFREEWYPKDYLKKGKAISKMSETGLYCKDILEHYAVLGFKTKQRFGKKITSDSIDGDVREFRKYLQERHFGESGKYPAGRLYREKRFRYMAFLAGNINKVITKLTEDEKKQILNSNPIKTKPSFSIDEFVKRAIWKQRDGYAVAHVAVPPLSINATLK